MCGRYTLTCQKQEIITAFKIEESLGPIEPSYNIAPPQKVPVVYYHPHTGKLTLENLEWGLIPSWAKTPTPDYNTINARSETLTSKPAFKKCLSSHRYLIPTDGFFEWDKNAKPKQPYRIIKKDHSLFALAGLWDEWVSADQSQRIKTFTIITTQANDLIKPLHDRMPAIISPQDYETWLKLRPPSLIEALNLLRPYPSKELTLYPVNSLLNNPHNNNPELIEPVKV